MNSAAATVAAKVADRIEGLFQAITEKEEGRRLGRFEDEVKSRERRDDLPSAVQYLIQMRRVKDNLEALAKLLGRLITHWEKVVIPHKMDIANTTTITVDGYRVTSADKYAYSIRASEKEGAYAWIKAQDKLADLVSETVNAASFSSGAKEYLKETKMDLPDQFFEFVVLPGTSVTRVNGGGKKK